MEKHAAIKHRKMRNPWTGLGRMRQRKIAFALMMAFVTSGSGAIGALLRNYGWKPGFFEIWLHTIEITYPIIVICILLIAPQITKLTNKLLP